MVFSYINNSTTGLIYSNEQKLLFRSMALIMYSIEIHDNRSLTHITWDECADTYLAMLVSLSNYSLEATINQFGLEFTSIPKYHALLCLYIFELIHDQLPLAVPCYDLVPVTKFTLGHINADFGHPRLPWLDGRWVQDLRTYSPQFSWPAITSNSSFMESSCRLQSELRPSLDD